MPPRMRWRPCRRVIFDATVFQDAAGQGSGAVNAALALARGEAVEQKVYVPFLLVTPANVADFAARN